MASDDPHPGIRIVRPLARDAHRESMLVQVEGESGGPAVLVRPLDALGSKRCLREIAGLHRAHGSGLVALVDVLDDGFGPALLRSHVAGPTLAAALAERERWAAGEAVSALHPVVGAVSRMHASGVAHGTLDARCIVLGQEGAVVASVAAAVLFAPGSSAAVLDRSEHVARDRAALRGLAREVLGRVAGARAEAAAELIAVVDGIADRDLLATLAEGLAELAAPVPYRPPSVSAVAASASARIVPIRLSTAEGAASGDPAHDDAAPVDAGQ
ncbi:hypothetical protein FJ656_12325, partial [Schumannella luteola]